MMRHAHAGGTVVELTRPRPHVLDEFVGGVYRHRWVHRQSQGAGSNADNGRETLHWIVGNALEQANVRREGVADHHHGVAVRADARHGMRPDIAACAWFVFDDDRLAPPSL